MSVQVPEAVQWLLELVVGEQWPDGDEDALRELAGVWSAAADQLDALRAAASDAANGVRAAAQGTAADAFAAYWAKNMDDGRTSWPAGSSPAALPWSVQFCRGMAQSCEQGALEIETAKLTIIANLVVLAATLAPQLLIPGEGEAAVAAEVPIAREAAELVLKEAVENILKKCLEEAVKMALIQAAVSLGAQLVEVAQGNRSGVDWHSVAASAEAGGLGGALGAGFGGFTGLAGRAVGGATEEFLGGGAGRITTAVAGGVATNVGTDLALNGRVSLTDLAGGLGAAAVGGAAAGLDGVTDHGAVSTREPPDPVAAPDLHDALAGLTTLHDADGTVRIDPDATQTTDGSGPDIRADLDGSGAHTGLSGLDPTGRPDSGDGGIDRLGAPDGRASGSSGTESHPDLLPRRPLAEVRPFDRPGGLKQVEPEYQQAVELAVPRRADGTPLAHPTVDHSWVDEINDGGPAADPGRATNCVDGVRAGLATYYGDPQAAAARLPEFDAAGRPSGAGEIDGIDNMEAWAGARYSFAGAGRDGLAAVEAKVRAAGPGSSAAVVVSWPRPDNPVLDPHTGGELDPGSHQLAVVNDGGTVTWIDFQTRAINEDFPYPRVEHVWSIALDAERNPILEPHSLPDSADPDSADPDSGPVAPEKAWTPTPDGGMRSPDGELAVSAEQHAKIQDVQAKAFSVEQRVTPILKEDGTHDIYEEQRRIDTPGERKLELQAMRDGVFRAVPVPPGATELSFPIRGDRR